MSASTFDDLFNHVGHEIEVVTYGPEKVANVSCECVTCGEVIIDFDSEEEKKTSREAIIKAYGLPAETTKAAWDVSRMLTDAAHLIDLACVNSDEPTDERLAQFDWTTIASSLDEVAAELRAAAYSITAPPMVSDSLLVAFDINGPSRKEMHEALVELLSTYINPVKEIYGVESWWVAEDDRTDRSDNDSAVFVPMGQQQRMTRDERYQEAYSEGYDVAIDDLADWHRIWTVYMAGEHDELATLTQEERDRVSSVVDNGGKFEDFVRRELFFIREA